VKSALILLIVLLNISLDVHGQTNLTISGVTYTNARVEKVNPAEVKIWHSSGIATLPIYSLPIDMQEQLRYNPTEAELYRQQLAERQRHNTEATRISASIAAKRKQLLANVVQVFPDGLLVSGEEMVLHEYHYPLSGTYKKREDTGTIYFLIGYPNTVVFGDNVDCFAYEDGNYTYTSIEGAVKTVAKQRYLDGAKPSAGTKPRQSESIKNKRVLQVLPDGLLLQDEYGEKKVILLVDYPRQNSVVDGDTINCRGYEDGVYTYNTAQGASMTVRKWRYVAK